QMMHSDAHLFELARRLRYFDFKREFSALAASMADVDASTWRQHFRRALLRDLIPRSLKPIARRLEGILHPEQRPSWYTRSFRSRAFRRRVDQCRPKGYFFTDHIASCYGVVTSAHCLNLLEEVNKISAAQGFDKAYPFMDRDVIEFVMAIP